MELEYGHISVSIYISITIISAKKIVKANYWIENVWGKKNPSSQWLFIKFLTFESLHNTVEQNTQEILIPKSHRFKARKNLEYTELWPTMAK